MIDLHCHSTCSDGSLEPIELLRKAEQLGLTYFSISDHNNARAYEAIADPAVRSIFSGKIVRGIELTTFLDGQMIEILGYGIAPKKLEPTIQKIRERGSSQRLMELLYKEYRARGIYLPFPMEEYDPKVYLNPRRYVFKQLVDYPQNHRFFLDFEAHTDSPLTYYRQELYNEKSPLYIDCSCLYVSAPEIIDAIHQAGGLAFMAHSFCYTDHIHGRLDEITDRLPLDGLECCYSSFTPEQTESIIALCKRKGLLMSGGSDFHGKLRPAIELGIGTGNLNIPDSLVSDWIEPFTF